MKHTLRTFVSAAMFAATPAFADGPFHNRDNKDLNDAGEPTYPVPYQLPTVAEITESLVRVRSNAWALGGLAEVYQRKGDAKAEAAARRAYVGAWLGGAAPDVARL